MIKILSEWEEVKNVAYENELYTLSQIPASQLLKILDDSACHGFEYKVENGKLYCREFAIESYVN